MINNKMPTIFSIVFAVEIIDKQPFNVNTITMNHITNNKTSKNLTFIFFLHFLQHCKDTTKK